MPPSGGGSKVEPTCGPRAAPRKGKRRATPPPWQTERERPALRHVGPTYAWFFLREKEHHRILRRGSPRIHPWGGSAAGSGEIE